MQEKTPPLHKRAQPNLALTRSAGKDEEAHLSKTRGNEVIEQLIGLLKNHPQVRALFARFDVPIEQIDKIPIGFRSLDVSAKTKDGSIWLNENLLHDGDLVGDLHYCLHELVHALQQISGQTADHNPASYDNYLDDEFEIEAFREQIIFIKDCKGKEEAKKYLNDLLDFHEFTGKKREEKRKQIGGTI